MFPHKYAWRGEERTRGGIWWASLICMAQQKWEQCCLIFQDPQNGRPQRSKSRDQQNGQRDGKGHGSKLRCCQQGARSSDRGGSWLWKEDHPTSNTATSCPLRRSRKVRGCLESNPGITSQPRRGMDAMWVFRSVLSLCRMSLLSLTRHQRSRQRLLESTFRWPAMTWSQRSTPREDAYAPTLCLIKEARAGTCTENAPHTILDANSHTWEEPSQPYDSFQISLGLFSGQQGPTGSP